MMVGIKNSLLSERLQLDANLMLEKAKTGIRQKEAVQEQQGILKGDTKSNPIANTQCSTQGSTPCAYSDNKSIRTPAAKQRLK